VTTVCHVPGDAWNVNPPALARVPRLYCRNERVVIPMTVEGLAAPLVLVAVGAILVGSVHVHGAGLSSVERRAAGPSWIPCDVHARRGDELGFFHHGSTIIVLAPPGLSLDGRIALGARVRVGEPLLRR
jgi:phosphatidylserine decarboxylase